MENKKSLLAKLNPANLRFTNKIMLLVLLIVGVVLVFYFAIGLRTLRHSLIKQTGKHLEELSYTKASEVEVKLDNVWNKLVAQAEEDELQSAGSDLVSAYTAISEIWDTKVVKKLRNGVSDYYQNELKAKMPISGQNAGQYIPSDWKTLVGQYLYTLEDEEKEDMIALDIANISEYQMYHPGHHGYLVNIMHNFGASDLYLIDPESGYVVYTAAKNIDFGSNLYEGKLQNTGLAEAFLKAAVSPEGKVSMTDYSRYVAAGDKAVCFISVPVMQYNQLSSVLVLQFDHSLFDNMLFDESFLAEKGSLDYAIIAQDLKYRNNPRGFLNKKDTYLKTLQRKSKRKDREDIDKTAKTGSLSLYLGFPDDYKEDLLSQEIVKVKDFLGTKVVVCSKKLNIDGNELFLVTKIDEGELMAPFTRQLILYILLSLLLLGLIVIVLRVYGNSFSSRLYALLDALKLLTGGEKSHSLNVGVDDEVGATIGAYNSLRTRMNNAEEFALEMSEGNYNYQFDILGERDSLGKSLNVLKDKLIKSKEEQESRNKDDEIRNWINSGIAKFNDILRENNDDINLLAYSIIENMIGYLDAQVGGIFLIEGEDDMTIDLVASYAYDRRKYEKKSQPAKEGLLGACFQEKKPIFLKELPEDYLDIGSGLGKDIPKCLYMVPLMVDENVLGILELAAFKEFDKNQIELIDRVADSIAATFVSVRLNMKTAALLEESNSRAEEIAQQEEEMRQNLEEMQATQEELARLRQEDEKRTNEMQLIVDNTKATLKSLLEAIPGGYSLKDANGIVHLINKEGAKYYGISVDRIMGKTDHELLPAKLYETEHNYDLKTLEEGEQQYEESIDVKGESLKFTVVKKPFMMPEIGQQGVLTIRTEL